MSLLSRQEMFITFSYTPKLSHKSRKLLILFFILAPAVGIEPTTNWLELGYASQIVWAILTHKEI